MSNLNAGGLRSASFLRIFGFEAIRRALQSRKPDHARDAHTSIATGNRNIRRIGPPYDCAPHEHKREIARRKRQRSA